MSLPLFIDRILTIELLNTTNIIDIPTDLSIPINYLTNSDTDADNADVAPAGRHSTVRTPRAPSTRAPSPTSPTSGYICTRQLRTTRIYGWDVAS